MADRLTSLLMLFDFPQATVNQVTFQRLVTSPVQNVLSVIIRPEVIKGAVTSVLAARQHAEPAADTLVIAIVSNL